MSIPPGTDTEKSSMGVHLLNGIAQYSSCKEILEEKSEKAGSHRELNPGTWLVQPLSYNSQKTQTANDSTLPSVCKLYSIYTSPNPTLTQP